MKQTIINIILLLIVVAALIAFSYWLPYVVRATMLFLQLVILIYMIYLGTVIIKRKNDEEV